MKNPLRNDLASIEGSNVVDPRAMFRQLYGVGISFEGLPLLTPSLLVFPAVPFGEARVQDPMEPDPFLRRWPNRPPFGDVEKQTILEVLATSYHSSYLETIKNIVSGASPTSAFARFGVVPRVVKAWIAKGSEDLQEGLDTYYSRFSLDMTRAVGMAIESAQIMVYVNNPLEFLERGMGQAMGDEYSPRLHNPSEAAIELTQLPAPPLELSALESTLDDDYLRKEQEALQILVSHGYTPERMLKDHLNQHGNRTTDRPLPNDADQK